MDLSRRLLLTGGRAPLIRPPWSGKEDDFARKCNGCGICVTVCPEKILEIAGGNYPWVNFADGHCTFCGACRRHCPEQALAGGDDESPWSCTAVIGSACLARQGTSCRSCGEHCQDAAITFRLGLGGSSQPLVNTDLCSGCGACVGVCPVQAIHIF
ncbi:MAG: ferredoxin-type protein NapF [Desulfobulbaceae bacterium]|nr:MAG: ferredoxin-type protein NapF [Desulfobulbaceae bacterium]